MKRFALALALLLVAFTLGGAEKAQLDELTGVIRTKGVKAPSPCLLTIDGKSCSIGLRGEGLEDIPDGSQIWVRGRLQTSLYDNRDDPNPAMDPLQWHIYMDVTEWKAARKPTTSPTLPTLLLWEDFNYPDDTLPASIGWTALNTNGSGQPSVHVSGSQLTYNAHTTDTRAIRDFGLRPQQIELTIDAGADSSGLNIRYSAAGFYRIRWNKSTGTFDIDQVTTGGSTVVTNLATCPMPAAATSGDSETSYDLIVTDDGTDIIAKIRGYEHELKASTGGANFTNSWADYRTTPTSVALFFGGLEPSGFRSIRVWSTIPTWDEANGNPQPMWGSFEKSRNSAVRHRGTQDRTYVGWVTPWGSICIRHYDHVTQKWGAIHTIEHLAQEWGRWGRDDHNYPTIVVAEDGTVCVFVALHEGGGPSMYCWRSTNPEDVSAWDARFTFDSTYTTNNAGYPTPFRVTNGDLVLFYRGDGGSTSGDWFLTRSTDNGETWSARTHFASYTDYGVYAFLEQDPSDADHLTCFIYISQSASPTRSNVYHLETLDGGVTWQKADRTAISLPATESNLETVFISNPDQCRVTGIHFRNGKGACVIAYMSDPNTEYRYCWWTGSAWQTARVTGTSTWWNANNSSELPGGAEPKPDDPDEMIISTPVNGVFELQTWRTSDSGVTWAKTADITTGSARDNTRTAYVKNYHAGMPYVWYYGEYTGDQAINGAWDGFDDALILAAMENIAATQPPAPPAEPAPGAARPARTGRSRH